MTAINTVEVLPHLRTIHAEVAVPTTVAINPIVVMYPTTDFEAPRLSTCTGRNPKLTPKVTNWKVIAITETRNRSDDRMTPRSE